MSTLQYNYNSGTNQNTTIANISGRVTVCEANITALNQSITNSLIPITANSSVNNAVVGDYIVWNVGSTKVLTSYTLVACNNSGYGYGPNSLFWTILGSNNNSTWSVLDTQTNPSSNENFTIASPAAYQYYAISYQRVNVSPVDGLYKMIPAFFQNGVNFGNILGTVVSTGGSLSCDNPTLNSDPLVFFNNPLYGYSAGVAYTGGTRLYINGSILYPATTALSSINSLKSNVNTLTTNLNTTVAATNVQVSTLTTNSQLTDVLNFAGDYITWDVTTPTVCASYYEFVTTSTASGNYYKMGWAILGSNNNSTWSLVDSKPYGTVTVPYVPFITNSTIAYRYFRMVIQQYSKVGAGYIGVTPILYDINGNDFGQAAVGVRSPDSSIMGTGSVGRGLDANKLGGYAFGIQVTAPYPANYPVGNNGPYIGPTSVSVINSYLYPVTTINSRLNVCEANITSLQNTVAQNSNSITALNTTVANISGSLVTANSRLTVCEANITALNTGLVTANANITALQTKTTFASLNVTGTSTLSGVSITTSANSGYGVVDINVASGSSNTANTYVNGVYSKVSIDPAFGGVTAADISTVQGLRGRVSGANLVKAGVNVSAIRADYNIAGTNAAQMKTAVLASIQPGTNTADAAVIAYIEGDSGVSHADAAYAVRMANSTPGSGFTYGVDLTMPNIVGGINNSNTTNVAFDNADIRLNNGLWIKSVTGALAKSDTTSLADGTIVLTNNMTGLGKIFMAVSNALKEVAFVP